MGAETLHDLTAAYALDALDEGERRNYEAHLAHCERCRDELGTFAETTNALAYAASGPVPPAELRGRILAAARAERPNVVPLRPRWAVPAAVAAVAAVAATVALAVWVASLSNHVGELQARSDRQERVAAVLTAPGRRTYGFGGLGRLVVTPNGSAALVLRRLGPAAAGKTYEAWVASGGSPKPAGTFNARPDLTAVPLDADVPAGAVVMLTQERAGGSSKPTQKPFVMANT